jgi:hypothetical protein
MWCLYKSGVNLLAESGDQHLQVGRDRQAKKGANSVEPLLPEVIEQ